MHIVLTIVSRDDNIILARDTEVKRGKSQKTGTKDLDKTEQRETRSAKKGFYYVSNRNKVQRWRHEPVNRKMNCEVSQTKVSSDRVIPDE